MLVSRAGTPMLSVRAYTEKRLGAVDTLECQMDLPCRRVEYIIPANLRGFFGTGLCLAVELRMDVDKKSGRTSASGVAA